VVGPFLLGLTVAGLPTFKPPDGWTQTRPAQSSTASRWNPVDSPWPRTWTKGTRNILVFSFLAKPIRNAGQLETYIRSLETHVYGSELESISVKATNACGGRAWVADWRTAARLRPGIEENSHFLYFEKAGEQLYLGYSYPAQVKPDSHVEDAMLAYCR